MVIRCRCYHINETNQQVVFTERASIWLFYSIIYILLIYYKVLCFLQEQNCFRNFNSASYTRLSSLLRRLIFVVFFLCALWSTVSAKVNNTNLIYATTIYHHICSNLLSNFTNWSLIKWNETFSDIHVVYCMLTFCGPLFFLLLLLSSSAAAAAAGSHQNHVKFRI